MNESISQFIEKAKDFLATLSPTKRISLFVGAGVLVVAMIAVMMIPKDSKLSVLYKDLSEESSAKIGSKLSEMGVRYEVSPSRTVVYVPQDKVDELRMALAQEGLPNDDIVGFESFDSFNFGTSSYVQRIQYIRAVQGELTRSIQRIDAVKRARVHISMPPKKVFLEEQESPKASVVLDFESGKSLTQAEIKGIAHIVSSAVEGLSSDKVTVVDQKGAFLLKPDEDGEMLVSNKLLEMQRSIEKSYQKRIQDLLSPVVGSGKVVAKVTADIENRRTSFTEESYDGDKAVPNAVTQNEEVSTGSRPNPIGIPGSRSNLPGAEVENPPVPNATSNTETNTSTTSYSIPRKVETTSRPSGSIKRLTVAVLVDGNYVTDPNDATKKVYQPRSEEEIQRIQEIVSNAVGFDASRRDSISVKSMPFQSEDLFPEETVEEGFKWENFVGDAIRNGIVGLVIVLFFLLVLRPFMKWLTLSEVEKELSILPKTVEEVEAIQSLDEGVLALTKEVPQLESIEDRDKKEKQDMLDEIASILEKTPKKGMQIIQDWLDEPSYSPQEVAA